MERSNDDRNKGSAIPVAHQSIPVPSSDYFNIRDQLPHYEARLDDYRQASLRTRSILEARLNVSYGTHPDEKLDLFFPTAKNVKLGDGYTPIHMFVHGGYWHKFSKDYFSFVADSIVHEGAIAAIVGYSRMPTARLETLVEQIRCAALWLRDHAYDFNGHPNHISVSGHSAGAHLASYLICRGPRELHSAPGPVRSVLLVSGIFDLVPIARSFLQSTLAITDEEITDWSPCRAIARPDIAVRITVGQDEGRPFLDFADAFAAQLSQIAPDIHLSKIIGQDHMAIVQSLGIPGSACTALLRESIAASLI